MDMALMDWAPPGRSGASAVFECLSLERANLAQTVLRFSKLRDVRLVKSDLSNADLGATAWDRVEVLEGRLTGMKASEASFQDVRFVDCKADFALFRFAEFRDCHFEACVLKEADFQGADLRGVVFKGSDIRGANFTGARLDQADFRGVNFAEAVLRPEDLKGIVIDADQALELAPFFAQALGVTVVER